MNRGMLFKKLVLHASLASLLAGPFASLGADKAGAEPLQTTVDYTKVPKLLITELAPDSTNVSGADAYEFIEVYNNSSEPVSFKDYQWNYHYFDSKNVEKNDIWPLVSATDHPVIQPRGSVVFWVMNSSNTTLTAEQFNANYGTSLTEGTNLFRLSGGGGMSNSAPRDLIIKDGSGQVVVSASYQNDDQTLPDKGIFYAYPADGSTSMSMVTAGAYAAGLHNATPGMVESQLVPEFTYDDPNPQQPSLVISHAPVTEAIDDSDLDIAATIATDVQGSPSNVTGAVYYKLNSESSYTKLPMNMNPDRSTADQFAFEASIPKERLLESKLQYYIEANDGQVTKATEVYTVNIRPSFNYNYVPAILITELNPNSANLTNGAKTANGYEFIEVYNNSDKTINLKDYKLMYRYTDKTPNTETLWDTGSVVIPSQKSVVLWIANGSNDDKTDTDFNSFFGSNLKLNESLFKITNDGMANGGARSIVIRNSADQEIVSAHYEKEVSGVSDKPIFYKYPDDGTTQMILDRAGTAAATPGTVEPLQVPKLPASLPEEGANEPPVIKHTPVTEAETNVNLQINAEITNKESAQGLVDPVMATVHYKTGSQADFTTMEMNVTSGNHYLADIPREELKEATFQYYIEAKDAKNTVKTDTYTVAVHVPDFDPAKVPPLLVTELVPNTTNVGSADGYEFIEIYNNTDRAINLKDYKLYYRYTDSGSAADIVWPTDREDMIIGAGKTLVFWVINSANGSKTAADFNALFHTNLVENQDIYKVYSDGMANTGKRGVVIGTNTHVDISAAYYDGSLPKETAENKGIEYKFPTNGSTTMLKLSAGVEAPSPGSVNPAQVPDVPVTVADDTQPPVFTDMTGITSIDQSKDLAIVGDASDNVAVKSVKLFYKSDQQADYSSRYLYVDYNDFMYHFTIYSPDLIGKSYMEYYFVVSDGTHEITSNTYRVDITGGPDCSALRLNLKDGDILSGTKAIKGTLENGSPDSLQLEMDGSPLTAGTYHALEQDAYFAFEANAVNYYFKNGVTIGNEILYTFMDPINSYTTLSVPIQASRLKEGGNTISIRAGSKSSPFDDRPEENKDDFTVKNIRLVFADGTVLYDPNYADPNKEIKMGDSAGKNPVVDFNFNLPAERLKSQAYDLDTTTLPDGPHTITVNSAEGQKTANIVVDNTKPEIVPSIESGKMIRGEFTLDAQITDALAGVASVEASLDEQKIELPLATASSKLSAGAHTFVVKAADKVGNASEQTVTFEVPDENPAKPELMTPTHDQKGATPQLSVKVQDPTKDAMNVSFYKGFLFDALHRTGLAAFKNASEVEPPKQLKPEGEQALSEEEYSLIGTPDGKYLTNDSDDKFPYHRFEVKLDPTVKPTDKVEIDWQGKSLEGRQVSMYGWSPADGKWNKLDGTVAGNEDFSLAAEVPAGDYAVDGTIHVIIQDELPVKQDPYDFSFVWMSDTQYYSESYPEIYEGNVKWIVDHKDDMNIKYVIHTGDIVDEADKEYQWQEADKDMKVLEDAKIPYGVLAGNHDVSHQYADYTKFYQYFGEDRFKSQPTYGGSYLNNRGHYDLVSGGGNDFVVIYMGWDIRDEDIQWMDDVVKMYPDRKAILDFHEYLLVSNNRAPISEKIYDRVVVPNKNVIAVLCGHYHDAEELVDEIDDNGDGVPDRKVYQLLADYQGAEKGGLGYIRLLQFDVKNNQIHVKTYSPYLDDYNYYDPTTYPGKDEYDLDVNLQPMHKQVATDYFAVKVYTDQLIGKQTEVASGGTASTYWGGLSNGGYYQWYAEAEDAYSGKTRSDVWGFTAAVRSSHSHGSQPSSSPSPSAPANPPAETVPAPETGSTQPPVTTAPGSTTPSAETPPVELPFRDVDSSYDWAKEAIGMLTAKGIIQGTTETSFEPGQNITRADFMTLLVRMLDLKADVDSNFSDVSAADYYYETLGIVKKLGIADGVGENKFNPRESISRQDMMVLLMRALQVTGKLNLSGTASDLNSFQDKSDVAVYALDAIAAMVQAGIVQGDGTSLHPTNPATRAETAQLLYRVYAQLK
ncbi:S-layer homology domain-containing protein [Paenibacillus sp. TAB 01]|uniref:S-layer homology domain-containing protein n=1 Tax=Paenibacillus sp. TAB 01 TaxID=3368988 RepID=UPI003751F566